MEVLKLSVLPSGQPVLLQTCAALVSVGSRNKSKRRNIADLSFCLIKHVMKSTTARLKKYRNFGPAAPGLRGTFVFQISFEKLNRSETATNIYTGRFFDLLVNFFHVLYIVILNPAGFWGYKTVFDNYSLNFFVWTIEKLKPEEWMSSEELLFIIIGEVFEFSNQS